MMRIGVISDTHGRLPAAVHAVFRGVSLIIHAGDIGGEGVIEELETTARVVAVRGNVDGDLGPPRFPDTRRFTLEGVDIFLCHQPSRAADLAPLPDVVIHGHTHQADNTRRDGVLWVNPGTASKPQFGRGTRSVAILILDRGLARAEVIPLPEPDA